MQGRLVNNGIKHIVDILGKDQTEDADTLDVSFIRLGSSNATPKDLTLTDLVTPSPTYFQVGSTTRNTLSPFSLTLTVILPLTNPPRPYSAKEVGLYVGTAGNEIMIARGTLTTALTIPANNAEVITIDFVIV